MSITGERITLLANNTNNTYDQIGQENDVEEIQQTRENNLGMHDESPGSSVSAPSITDTSFTNSYSSHNDFKDYLSRPVLIDTTVWTENTFLSKTILPWHLYFNNAAIKKKIDNYAYVNCKLHLKVVINASQFYYGLGYGSYRPYTPANAGSIDTAFSTIAQNVLRSQRPNVEIWPANNSAGEIELPFLYHQNWLDITSSLDLQEMGEFALRSYTPLRNANSVAGTNITIRTYAWTSDLCVTGPTSKLAVQSKDKIKGKKDEYAADGIISKPAAAVSAVAASLGEVPVIGPFALATSFAASAISSISSIFGYTNVPVVEDVKPYKNLPFHSMASSEISQPSERLCFHPKNEVTIDNRVAGISSDDEMLISNIIGRNSFVFQTTWDTHQAPNTTLMYTKVTPQIKKVETFASVEGIFKTPLCHISELFYKWRGDIIFTFKIAASKYHRGRLRLTYDPRLDPVTAGSMPDSANTTNIVEIFDITDKTVFEFRVPYMATTEFLDSGIPNNVENISTTPVAADLKHHNGYLFLDILTELSSPVATAPVDVNVFVRGATAQDGQGQSIEFCNPRDIPINEMSLFRTQSKDIMKSEAHSVSEDVSNRYKIYVGEPTTSLRQMLHRSVYIRTITPPSDSVDSRAWLSCNFPRYPPIYGYDPSGFNTANEIIGVGTHNFNYVSNNPFNWLAACFVGSRGSVTWEINPDSADLISSIKIVRHPDYQNLSTDWNKLIVSTPASTSQFNSQNVLNMEQFGAAGQSLTNARSQTGIAVNSPNYLQYRFLVNNLNTRNYGTDKDGSYRESLKLIAKYRPNVRDSQFSEYDLYFRTGHDFNFVYFLNVPTVYRYGSVPAAV